MFIHSGELLNKSTRSMHTDSRQVVLLETSSYLPLLWRTPYTLSLVRKMQELATDHVFALQADCIREASGYLAFEDDWKYHAALRIRRLLGVLSDDDLCSMGFPSTAVQILLGGNIWPQGKYLNFVRHSVFFFSDLLDAIDFHHPRTALSELANRIDRRIESFRRLFQEHETSEGIVLPQEGMLPYWGDWYLPATGSKHKVSILQDHCVYDAESIGSRDAFHYEFALQLTPRPAAILVADQGFRQQARKSFNELSVRIICATTSSASIYG